MLSEVKSVVMLGAGFMGAALAQALANAGCEVTLWNRTYEKARAIEGERIVAEEDIAEAVQAADLLVACVRNYEDLRQAIEGVDLARKTLVNVSSGTAADAEGFAQWMLTQGVRYLDGAVICYPANVGTERGTVLLSGDRGAWDDYVELLKIWGPGVEWLGEDPGTASAVDAAVVGGFHIASLLAFCESAGYAIRRGVSSDLLLRVAERSHDNFGERMRTVVEAISSDDFATDQAVLATYAQAVRGYVEGIEGEGYRVPMMGASRDVLNSAEESGFGGEHISAVVKAG